MLFLTPCGDLADEGGDSEEEEEVAHDEAGEGVLGGDAAKVLGVEQLEAQADNEDKEARGGEERGHERVEGVLAGEDDVGDLEQAQEHGEDEEKVDHLNLVRGRLAVLGDELVAEVRPLGQEAGVGKKW